MESQFLYLRESEIYRINHEMNVEINTKGTSPIREFQPNWLRKCCCLFVVQFIFHLETSSHGSKLREDSGLF